ncbi:MAG: hypothetical protein HFF83_08455 [Oscillibacter sp.]|jgi:hypothetical protein|nr:hypothetical protein [Oscillibacter sp.]
MKRLLHNCKGAVTVMVTLLLIPAILVSGTGVDLARIYTARSIVQDANQLAANSVLASYEALLHDLYGLFGIMSGGNIDPDTYIRQAIMGGDWDKGMGTFQIFYGSNLNPTVLTPEPAQNLGNNAVLRRQVEDYSKFRAPPIIVELLMEKLDVFEKIQEDAKVIKKKMDVDDGVEELEKCYRKIYDWVIDLDKIGPREDEIAADYSATAKRIQDILVEMQGDKETYRKTIEAYEAAKQIYESTEDEDERAAAKETMDEMDKRALEIQLSYQERWGKVQDASNALWTRFRNYESELSSYRDGLEKFLDICRWAEYKKEDLQKEIEELRDALENGDCSNTLKRGLTQPEEGAGDGLSIMERYEALLKYNIEEMGQALRDHNDTQLEKNIQMLNEAKLGPVELLSLRTMNVDSNFPLAPDSTDSFSEVVNASTVHQAYGKGTDAGYRRFEEGKPPESREFWNELKTLYDETDGKGAKKKNLEEAITTVFKEAQSRFKEAFEEFAPAGADYLSGGVNDSGSETGCKFGTEDDWKDKDEGKKEMKDSLDGDFLQKLANMANEAGNKLLILVYDTEMFSDFSCPKDGESGYPKENMAGIPLSTDVNYYFQSELEYLYNGNLADAVDNLKSVAGMMLLVRFVLDYVASFSVSGVNSVVNGVKAALAWTGPFAILAGELARLGLSIGEAVIDVGRLRSGDEVAVFKSNDNWRLSIDGLVKASTDTLSKDAVSTAFGTAGYSGSDSTATEHGDEGITMNYTDYMRLFLLLVPGDTLADRTRRLIELNITNYQKGIDADENAMANAERYDLGELFTGFTLTTTVDMRMLFLSMPFAQEGVAGIVPPKTLPVSVTDYRGY